VVFWLKNKLRMRHDGSTILIHDFMTRDVDNMTANCEARLLAWWPNVRPLHRGQTLLSSSASIIWPHSASLLMRSRLLWLLGMLAECSGCAYSRPMGNTRTRRPVLASQRPNLTEFSILLCHLWPWLSHFPTAVLNIRYFRFCG